LPADFVKGLFLCMFSASSDMTKGILTCVHIDGKKVNSSDEVRISEYTMETAIDKEVLIPARNVVELVSFDIKDYCINENWAHFKTSEGVIFSSRIMAGDYEKDFSPFLDVDAEAFELPEGFKDIIESITFMTEGDVNIDKVVNLQIKDKKIICRAEKEIGWIEKEVEFNFDHNVTIQINPNFLSQVLEKATKLKAGEDRALFESGNFKHVIALPED